MKAKPILFSAEMIRALLDGRKTQTRRVAKDIPIDASLGTADDWNAARADPRMTPFEEWGPKRGCFVVRDADGMIAAYPCPYGAPGDALIVKESAWMWCERVPNGVTKTGRPKWHYVPMREAPIHYAADHPSKPATDVVSPDTGNQWGWRFKVGRFMPAWASRLTLRITNVRIEPLQEISEADARAEGVLYVPGHGDITPFELRADPGYSNYLNCRMGFEALWSRINDAESWDANPWCWALSFDVIQANVDKMLRVAA